MAYVEMFHVHLASTYLVFCYKHVKIYLYFKNLKGNFFYKLYIKIVDKQILPVTKFDTIT